MNIHSHFLTAIFIQSLIFKIFGLSPLSWILVLVFCFFSHWIVDSLSCLTFHPDYQFSIDHPNDKFHKFTVYFEIVLTVPIVIYFAPFCIKKRTNTNFRAPSKRSFIGKDWMSLGPQPIQKRGLSGNMVFFHLAPQGRTVHIK